MSQGEETKAVASRLVKSPEDDATTFVDGVDGDGGERFTLKSNRGSEPMIDPVMPLKPGKSRIVNPMQVIKMSRFGAGNQKFYNAVKDGPTSSRETEKRTDWNQGAKHRA